MTSTSDDLTGLPPNAWERSAEYREWAATVWESRLARSGLEGRYREADSPEGRACFRRYLEGRGSYLHGLPGRGKTWAAACCVLLALKRGESARFTTAKDLLDDLRAEYDGKGSGALKRAGGYGLLVLDDLGMERPTEWAMEQVSALIDTRCARHLPTVVTSNYPLGELGRRWGGMEGARLVSRLRGACEEVEMTGSDRRVHG